MQTKQMMIGAACIPLALAGSLLVSRGVRARAARNEAPPTIAPIDADDELDDDDGDDDDGDRAFYGVWSLGRHAYAVGEAGTVYHSSDGGESWFQQTTGVPEDLRAVWGAAPDELYAVGDGGRILRSRHEGEWVALASGTDEDLRAVWGAGPRDIYVAGDAGTVLHSTDRGATWRRLDSGTDEDLRAISAAPGGGVIVVGEGGALRRVRSSADAT
ncbi:MAG TPA: hypothetical protein VFF06_01705 [Polyangia bacterium]|nr:hypothetical protein [Polyangia bacterium]